MSKQWTILAAAAFTTVLTPDFSTTAARADIFQWEYINPANPSQGKQQSATLTPDGAGAVAAPGANLANRNLTKAFLVGTDLSPFVGFVEFGDITSYTRTDLTNATLNDADLSYSAFNAATMTGANLTGADVRGAIFDRYDQYGLSSTYGYGSGLTPAQLYSTVSYAAHDLTGISLGGNSLAGVNLAGQNLTRANFNSAALNGANLNQANLNEANFYAANLTGANLTGALVRGAYFSDSVLSTAQLYSTASYQDHDLGAISLHGNYPGINLAGQNLIGASFSADLSGANFANADLTHVYSVGTNLTNANFSGANLTDGVIGHMISGANFSNGIIRGANMWGLSKVQLYSTASYQTGDLTGIYFYSAQTNWNFAGKNLSRAQFVSGIDFSNSSFAGADLTDANLASATLQNANLSYANLTGADLSYCKLTGANFNGANVRGAKLARAVTYPGSGISISQLAATASYQSHDLSGIGLRGNLLNGANLAGQNLTNADMVGASLVGANFTGAVIRGAQFHIDASNPLGGLTVAQLQSTASYQNHDLRGIGLSGYNLAGMNLVGQDLSNSIFELEAGNGANLSGADLTGANLTNARLGITTLAGATLVRANLPNLDLHLTTLTNANFSEANLSGSTFHGYVIVISGGEEGGGGYYNFPGADLSGANLAGANLTNARFTGTFDFYGSPFPGANLTNANLTGADVRGANFQFATMTGANFTNLINWHMAGLNLTAGASLIVRDYDMLIGPEIPIVVDQSFAMEATSTLQLVFDADPWGSAISFAPGITVARGGMLELSFAPEVNLSSQLGRTIDLFDWSGVTPTGTFNVASSLGWDLSRLYTTGEVRLVSLTALAGDFDADGDIDGADFVAWQTHFPMAAGSTRADGDADGDGDVDGADFVIWQTSFPISPGPGNTPVPEPPAALLISSIAVAFAVFRRRQLNLVQ